MSDKHAIKDLLKFSDNKGRITEDLTEDYRRAVQDAIARVEFLWLCEKYGAYDEQDYLVMDTYRNAMFALELLIEDK